MTRRWRFPADRDRKLDALESATTHVIPDFHDGRFAARDDQPWPRQFLAVLFQHHRDVVARSAGFAHGRIDIDAAPTIVAMYEREGFAEIVRDGECFGVAAIDPHPDIGIEIAIGRRRDPRRLRRPHREPGAAHQHRHCGDADPPRPWARHR